MQRRPCYSGSVLSTAFLDGLVFAAIVQDDRHGPTASRGLAPKVGAALRERLRELDALTRAQRHEVVRALVAKLVAIPTDAELPPRAALILAPSVPREVGRRWAANAPEVRRGFRVTRAVKSVLRHLAAPAGVDSSAEERKAAGRVAELSPDRAAAVLRVAAQHGGERAIGALMLGVEGHEGGDEATRRLRRIGRELALVWGAEWR